MSNINVFYRNVFVHVPKTAGVSMEVHSYIGGTGHSTFHQLTLEEKFDPDYFKWAFVRNPYDRLASAYFYLNHKKPEIAEKIVDPEKNFKSFIHNLEHSLPSDCYDETIPVDDDKYAMHIYPQLHFLKSQNHELDFIGRVENLKEDWKTVIDNIRQRSGNHSISWKGLHHKNRTFDRRGAYIELYTPEMKNIVYDIYKEDFITFNYSK